MRGSEQGGWRCKELFSTFCCVNGHIQLYELSAYHGPITNLSIGTGDTEVNKNDIPAFIRCTDGQLTIMQICVLKVRSREGLVGRKNQG